MKIPNTECVKKIGEEVLLAGWVHIRRDHGKIIFIDLRDRSGLIQLVFNPQNSPNGKNDYYKLADTLRAEYVIEVSGTVKKRPAGMENPKIETGEIEIEIEKLELLAKAKTPPFDLTKDTKDVDEELRMKYRYLDLRTSRVSKIIEMRHNVVKFIRDYLSNLDFWEIETPILSKSTPEGARDFIVPSRQQPGKFYALPQSPQQYKQMLMLAGIEKYFQIAHCLRDEDPRGDRQAEHTQLDIEMSFITQEDILKLIEDLYSNLIKKLFPEKKITTYPFPRMTYQQTLEKYKSDKPDLRKNKNDSNELAFAFIVDFPMFEWLKGDKKWGAMHHPFTKPQSESIEEMKNHPEKIKAFQYDFVLNGFEIGGGSIRTTNLKILEAVFEVLGHSSDEIKKQFGHYFEAFSYGVPPHGGIAPGIDRLIMLLANEPNIREVIAFPKTGDGRDLMMNAPSDVSNEQLKELKIKILKND
ncbi:MAG: aspartate--tRNA ligase [Candidatus Nealsonbacteria bacterium CG23_combo_of_CG06-09_8_20_14_all_40_13]|uniref:Aspartate--tRNA(Asp/Asn) ligase n=1 Tax=Candidatus Nealsonbacteria bacterium CG23_combo_of_CG06-09_8_20_14_all_40_13 TaxID=1974724 RepID=A0A2G9YR07_9BACT|nr:MAG: aspartate--tRNA ligase [Candidatus Nealsonbacteria bacterium CG23_combo_of_CG06-09_8_20_14_all_40_13]PIR70864.1 MAG: aspartate--tRNA ligase [Candidatus Nealsonbacteria bacterium CG10_big_fil_rev_8_21_14_0_10_40_24]PIU43048.1 MAG: aspartate--tRNA ligase [Candidatus Nealsonbacteria bacterium CG07_land_8_20_14_0_80_40_10]